MAADLKVKLGLDNAEFDKNLNTSRKKLEQMRDSAKNVNGAFGDLTKAVVAGKAAWAAMSKTIDFAKDVFMRSINATQSATDAWGRSMESVTSITNGFFVALSTGDFSSFLNGLNGIISAARDAYDALDRLATVGIFSNAEMAKNNAKRDKLVAAYRDPKKTKEEKEKILAEIKAIDEAQAKISKTQADASQDAANKLAKKAFAEFGVGNASQSEIWSRIGTLAGNDAAAKRFAEADAKVLKGTHYDEYGNVAWRTPEAEKILKSRSYKLDKAAAGISDETLKQIADLRTEAYRTESQLANQQGQTARLERSVMSSSTPAPKATHKAAPQPVEVIPEFSPRWFDDEIAKINKQISLTPYIDQDTLEALGQQLEDLKRQKFQMSTEAPDAPTTIGTRQLDFTPTLPANVGINPGTTGPSYIEQQKAKQEEFNQVLLQTSNIMEGVGDAIGGTAGKWIDFVGNMMSGIATLIPQLKTLFAAQESTAAVGAVASAASTPLVGWLTAGAALASIMGIIATIPKFATGGIVGGSSYSGDKILARLNSGEMVLNKRQQASLYNSLNSSSRAANVRFEIDGTTLYGVLQNYQQQQSYIG